MPLVVSGLLSIPRSLRPGMATNAGGYSSNALGSTPLGLASCPRLPGAEPGPFGKKSYDQSNGLGITVRPTLKSLSGHIAVAPVRHRRREREVRPAARRIAS